MGMVTLLQGLTHAVDYALNQRLSQLSVVGIHELFLEVREVCTIMLWDLASLCVVIALMQDHFFVLHVGSQFLYTWGDHGQFY